MITDYGMYDATEDKNSDFPPDDTPQLSQHYCVSVCGKREKKGEEANLIQTPCQVDLGNKRHRPLFSKSRRRCPGPPQIRKRRRIEDKKENQKKGFSAPLLHEYLRLDDFHRMDEAK